MLINETNLSSMFVFSHLLLTYELIVQEVKTSVCAFFFRNVELFSTLPHCGQKKMQFILPTELQVTCVWTKIVTKVKAPSSLQVSVGKRLIPLMRIIHHVSLHISEIPHITPIWGHGLSFPSWTVVYKCIRFLFSYIWCCVSQSYKYE